MSIDAEPCHRPANLPNFEHITFNISHEFAVVWAHM